MQLLNYSGVILRRAVGGSGQMQWAVGKVFPVRYSTAAPLPSRDASLQAVRPQNTCTTVTEDTLLEQNTAEEIKSANEFRVNPAASPRGLDRRLKDRKRRDLHGRQRLLNSLSTCQASPAVTAPRVLTHFQQACACTRVCFIHVSVSNDRTTMSAWFEMNSSY